jgi:hypothetical protein
MLYMSLLVSAFLFLVANLIVFRARKPVGKTVGFCAALALGPFFMMCVLPPVAIQGLLLALAVVGWWISRRGPLLFLRLSCAATLVAYGIAGRIAWQDLRENARLRDRYPYESMDERLPVPKRDPHQAVLSPTTAGRLSRLEETIESDRNWVREMQLRMLHEDAVGLFINSPGFGVARMMRPSERSLSSPLYEGPIALQPGDRVVSPWSPGELAQVPVSDEPFLASLFEESVSEFVYARGSGYVKDRRHVAGFVPHRFSRVPSPIIRGKTQDDRLSPPQVALPVQEWKVRTLDLVGLLLHDEPVVYVSDHLPRMAELRGAPTRPLDRFETYGLAAVRRGEDLLISRDRDGVRMLGAIYSTKRCVACHGGERGDLLGAFSYTLQLASR